VGLYCPDKRYFWLSSVSRSNPGEDHLETLKMGQTSRPETLDFYQKITPDKNLKPRQKPSITTPNLVKIGKYIGHCRPKQCFVATRIKLP
jgi:hypothetical protein